MQPTSFMCSEEKYIKRFFFCFVPLMLTRGLKLRSLVSLCSVAILLTTLGRAQAYGFYANNYTVP